MLELTRMRELEARLIGEAAEAGRIPGDRRRPQAQNISRVAGAGANQNVHMIEVSVRVVASVIQVALVTACAVISR